jgi:hypothetical protein
LYPICYSQFIEQCSITTRMMQKPFESLNDLIR